MYTPSVIGLREAIQQRHITNFWIIAALGNLYLYGNIFISENNLILGSVLEVYIAFGDQVFHLCQHNIDNSFAFTAKNYMVTLKWKH